MPSHRSEEDRFSRMKRRLEPSQMDDDQLNQAILRLHLALQKVLDQSAPFGSLRGEQRDNADRIATWLHELLSERETRKQKR
jgi:hypothetical protein